MGLPYDTFFSPHKIRGKTDFTQFPALFELELKSVSLHFAYSFVFKRIVWDCAVTEEIM